MTITARPIGKTTVVWGQLWPTGFVSPAITPQPKALCAIGFAGSGMGVSQQDISLDIAHRTGNHGEIVVEFMVTQVPHIVLKQVERAIIGSRVSNHRVTQQFGLIPTENSPEPRHEKMYFFMSIQDFP